MAVAAATSAMSATAVAPNASVAAPGMRGGVHVAAEAVVIPMLVVPPT